MAISPTLAMMAGAIIGEIFQTGTKGMIIKACIRLLITELGI